MIVFLEESLINIIKHLSSKKYLELNHVGDKAYSSISTKEFLSGSKNKVVEPLNSKSNFKVKIVAEITTNHLGNRDLLIQIVRRAKESGADLVKVQKRNVETFYSQKELDSYYFSEFGTTFREYRHGLELSKEDFLVLDKECKKIGIDWFASVLDKESLDFILEFDPKLIKIPSTISDFSDYHDYVAKRYKGDIVVSTGLTSIDYEDYIIKKFKNNSRIYLLQCTSSYPAELSDLNLSAIPAIQQRYQCQVGYSGHERGVGVGPGAVLLGASVIERHFTMDRTLKGPDHAASLEPRGLDLLVKRSNNYWKALGAPKKEIQESELANRLKFRGY